MKKFNLNIKKKPNQSQYREHQSGDTIVQYKEHREKKSSSNMDGEYVDFEDLNENQNE